MFSVLIPSYNHRAFLTECTLSALRSPLVSEVLLVDDGSTDRSPDLFELLRRFSPKVRILSSAPGENLGAHARLNQLVEAAANDWVAPLNSDDLLVSGRFEAVERTVKRGEMDLLFGDLVLIDGQGAHIGLRSPLRNNEVGWPPSWDIAALARERDWLPLLLLQNIAATTTNMVFTKQLHRELGGFRDFRYCHDWDFALRAAQRGRIAHAPTMLAAYRVHDGNTIKEATDRVAREVRRMLTTTVRQNPSLRENPRLTQLLGVNPYLAPAGPATLAVVLPDPLLRGLLQQEIAAARLPVHLTGSTTEVPSLIPYLYEPEPAGAAALRLNDLRTILLALATRDYDALLLLRHAGDGVDETDLPNALVLRRSEAGRWRSGAVRQIRLYPTNGLRLAGPAIKLSGAACVGKGVSVSIAAPLLNSDDRPLVFVLPAFLAVGGVERLVLETMRLLSDRWRFVVVTTEPLRPEQGSTHPEALPLAPVYDLAEISGSEDRLRSLEILNDWHAPALVWIMNGAPWQIDHAAELRRIFADIPVIDHQAYDHDAGWINRFADPGVRAADRFVAINQRIRAAMQERYAIPATQIDLIYHGSNMSGIRRQMVSPADVAAHRRAFGLDPERPVFGMIGRLTAQKRPLDLVELAKRVGSSVQFVWVGLGELEADMNAALRSVPNAKLIPGQSDLRPIYEMLDGLVITSGFEGLPIVLLEALAMGVPAVSTDVGAIKEVLERYQTGMTFAPAGDIDELECAFRAFLVALPKLRKAAARQAAQVCEDFSSVRMAREYESSFRQAIADFSRPF